MMTHVIARIFASLFSQGYGVSAEENMDDTGHELPQDATNGTGMDDGDGVKDVSDQIENEDQLLRAFENVCCKNITVCILTNLSCPFYPWLLLTLLYLSLNLCILCSQAKRKMLQKRYQVKIRRE